MTLKNLGLKGLRTENTLYFYFKTIYIHIYPVIKYVRTVICYIHNNKIGTSSSELVRYVANMVIAGEGSYRFSEI